jgi:hypothetical protein
LPDSPSPTCILAALTSCRLAPSALSEGAEGPQWIGNVDHESAAWLRGSPGLHGCAATLQCLHCCAEAPHGCAAARGRARRPRAQPIARPLTLVQTETLHSLTRTHGGGAWARGGAGGGAAGRAPRRVRPNCLRCDRHRRALFGEKASKPKNRRAPAWPQDGRTAALARLVRWPRGCQGAARRLCGCADARHPAAVSAVFGAALIRDSTIAGTATTASGNALQRGVGVVEGTE